MKSMCRGSDCEIQKDLAINEKVGDIVGQSETWWNLALVYEKQGKIPQAIELMEKTVAVEKKIGHPDAAKDEDRVARLRKKAQG